MFQTSCHDWFVQHRLSSTFRSLVVAVDASTALLLLLKEHQKRMSADVNFKIADHITTLFKVTELKITGLNFTKSASLNLPVIEELTVYHSAPCCGFRIGVGERLAQSTQDRRVVGLKPSRTMNVSPPPHPLPLRPLWSQSGGLSNLSFVWTH